jgi:hypothetical protein
MFNRKILSGLIAISGVLLFAISCNQNPSQTLTVASNPIVLENQKAGTTAWQPRQLSRLVSDRNLKEIKGYASTPSVNKGQTIRFYVSVNQKSAYTMNIYRMGYYNGTGGRLLRSLSFTAQQSVIQPSCNAQPAPPTLVGDNMISVPPGQYGLVECNWAVTYSTVIPTDWTSGIYIAHLVRSGSPAYENYMIFTVRDDLRSADFLYQQPVFTYQAYNSFSNPDSSRSLYSPIGNPAVKVSFDRPYDGYGDGDFGVNITGYGSDSGGWELPFVQLVESQGYDVSYATNLDLHTNPNLLNNYKAFLSVGHDEYWTKEMYDRVEAARNSGKHIGFFGDNNVYWQIRLENSSSGTPNRVVTAFKKYIDATHHGGSLDTDLWRNLNRPEQSLIGTMFSGNASTVDNKDFIATKVNHWVYQNSNLSFGDTIPKIIGQEVDSIFVDKFLPQNTTFDLVSESPYVAKQGLVNAHVTIYQAPSGAWVFSAGTLSWNWALGKSIGGYDYTNQGIKTITKNILDRFLEPLSIPKQNIYAIDSSGQLRFYKDIARNGQRNWHPSSGNIIGTYWNFKHVFSGGNGIIYAIDDSNRLRFYKDNAQNGVSNWHPNSGNVIGTGWNFKHVFSGGNGIIYAINELGQLRFYKDNARDGTSNWHSNSGNVIGTSWNFKDIVSDGNGIIYALKDNGDLYFYQDNARNGTWNWHPNSGNIITSDWNYQSVFPNYRHIFSGGNGVIYVVNSSGDLFLTKDLRQDGNSLMYKGPGQRIGNGWSFTQLMGNY